MTGRATSAGDHDGDDETGATTGAGAALAAVRQRVAERHRRWDASARRSHRIERRLSNARLVVFAAGVVFTIWLFRSHPSQGGWALAPALLFTGLVVAHGTVRERHRVAARIAAGHAASLDRLDERWPDGGRTGEDLVPAHHPFARDLDIVGEGSLFQRLDTTVTSTGAATLAGWLTRPAPAAVARARQAAVARLAPDLDLRERILALPERGPRALDRDALVAWAGAGRRLDARVVRPLAWGLAAAALGASALGLFTGIGWLPLVAVALVDAVVARLLAARIHAVVSGAAAAGDELGVLSGLLGVIEAWPPGDDRLAELGSAARAAPQPPSARLARLRRLLDAVDDARLNPYWAPFAFLLQIVPLRALSLEDWRTATAGELPGWLDAVGELEALLAVATWAHEHPDDVAPLLRDGGPCFHAEAIGHPLLPRATCVRNDLALDSDQRLVLLSGSNMSGKSTLLRTVGVNAVLAMAGAPVRARRLETSPFAVGAAITVTDSLAEGVSHFYAEIQRLRDVVALTNGPWPVLFLLDEILAGTNSSDRRHGAQAVVHRLVERGAVGLVTTHDLALAAIADELSPRARNAHFEDQIVDGRIAFDYRLRDGVVTRGNALALMRSLGLEV